MEKGQSGRENDIVSQAHPAKYLLMADVPIRV
jgi:hypothetical protein